jgi:nicotinamidase-related amidase
MAQRHCSFLALAQANRTRTSLEVILVSLCLRHENEALLVIDVQRDVVANAVRIDDVISNINLLITSARQSNVPVIWVQHSDDYLVKGSDGWKIVDELKPLPDEVKIYKTRPSSFADTDLAEQLESLGTTSLIITGAQTDYCVNATSNAAVELGYDVTLVSDAHTTEDSETVSATEIIDDKNVTFSQIGTVLPTAAVRF